MVALGGNGRHSECDFNEGVMVKGEHWLRCRSAGMFSIGMDMVCLLYLLFLYHVFCSIFYLFAVYCDICRILSVSLVYPWCIVDVFLVFLSYFGCIAAVMLVYRCCISL